MKNIDELITHFNFTQTRKSKKYLNLFFNKKSFDLKHTLYVQEKLKMFVENFQLLETFQVNENKVSYIQKFLDENNANQYTLLSSIRYLEYYRETNNNISLFIEFFYRFGLLLRNFQKTDLQLDYCKEIDNTISFINSLSVNEYYGKILDFNQRKALLTKLEKETKDKNNRFVSFWDFFYMFDVYSSISKGIRVHDLKFPDFNTENKFTVIDFYHLDLKKSVKNNLEVKNQNTVVFTGANMSGKSTAMKSLSTIVLLAHLGIAVPSAHCNIPFYESIFLHFSVNDNLKEGYSLFAQEIINLKKVLLELKSKTCFAVFDEIFSGTNINDASKITVKTIAGLSKFEKSMFIFSTHLNGIEANLTKYNNIKVSHLECFLEQRELKFTYQLKEGWSKLEVGNVLFEQYGLNELLEG
ncbi:hypothetical protein OMO38_02205 [Chryseobacterium sp. 09-1422]|uniref:DNA mismatch repair proteins mutS family domain-containing protein n=1 Tax=Chryseobacterium kimseyorum TaxID=2984028 RepID=A0ABT3HU56_9FLAO|nr:hypothetical protein [Chryseobacterium kimseyorum]MCW3167331.1 hypothetical protein [Chryseobacterium kimseyorum]